MRNHHKISWWSKLKRFLKKHEWLLICCLWLVTFVLGYIGSMKQLISNNEARSFMDPFYRSLQLFMIDDSMIVSGPVLYWELEAARFMAPVVATYTLFATLTAVFHEKFQLLRLRFVKNHVVICGLGRKGILLAKGFYECGYYVVVIEQDQDNGLFDQCRDSGVLVLVGNTADRELLRRARVHKAKYLISVCGDDGINAEVAVHAYELAENHKGRLLTCFIHIFNPNLYRLLMERAIVTEKADSFRLEFFNIFDSGARVILDKYPLISETEETQNLHPHILLIGLGRLGEGLVVHTARNRWMWKDKTSDRLRVTVIDTDAKHKIESLCLRYPQLDKVCDLNPQDIDVCSPEFESGKFLFDSQGHCDVTSVYVCFDDDSLGLTTALTIRQHIMKMEKAIPIVVRMTHNAGLATILRGVEQSSVSFDNLYAFGLLDQTCTPELLLNNTHEEIARAIHQDYVKHQEKSGITPRENPHMVSWDKLPEEIKESNRLQADHMGIKLKSVGCSLVLLTEWDAKLFEFNREEIELMSEMEHERWVKEREQAGWKLGPKDTEKKITPHLIPWGELTDEIKELDRNTVRGMPAFLARAGFQIYRLKQEEGVINDG